jgi:hypothetical protein
MPIWDKISELTGHGDGDEPKAVAKEQSGHPKALPPPAPGTEHKPSSKHSDWHDKVISLFQILQ